MSTKNFTKKIRKFENALYESDIDILMKTVLENITEENHKEYHHSWERPI
jgi:hypothetical protein